MDCLKKYLTEFIGTFFLVFTVGVMVVFAAADAVPALAIGLVLMAMVYAGGHISGGHYNPAVSLACAIRGCLSFKHLVQYWISQFLGAVAATYTVIGLAPNELFTAECPYDKWALAIGEFLFTFALCYVVLNTATSKDNENNSFYGLAIGLVVAAGIFTVGGTLCYAAFNPAVALSLGLTKATCWSIVGITMLSNFIAAAAAAVVFKLTSD